MHEFNFIHKDLPESDRELFFGPLGGEEFIEFDDDWQMDDVWVRARFFASKSQARKNNHGGPIPAGFNDYIKKRRGIRVTILNRY